MYNLRANRRRNQHFRVTNLHANTIGFTAFQLGLDQAHRTVTRLRQTFHHTTKTQITRTGNHADINMLGQLSS